MYEIRRRSDSDLGWGTEDEYADGEEEEEEKISWMRRQMISEGWRLT